MGRLWGRAVEWDQVLALLARETSTPVGREGALGLTPWTERPAVQNALRETREARRAIALAGLPPWGTIPDLRLIMDGAERPGSALDGPALAAFMPFFDAIGGLRAYGYRVGTAAPGLGRRFSQLQDFSPLKDLLTRTLTDEGALKDDASPQLKKVRSRIRDLRREIVRRLEALFALADADALFHDRFVTLRQGRYVVPVRSEARARVRGLVHDRSQSGATLFIEPEPVVEANNELMQLLREQEWEITRILEALTNEVRSRLPELRGALEEIGALDLIAARGQLAERMDASEPEIDPGKTVALSQARHPLLLARRWREPDFAVVPVDLLLSREHPLLVVTGPNAGGKTAALKCLGLSVLMAQAGLHLPVREGSRLPVFSRLFAVVGDDQSVAEDLSTFSAFVKQVKTILTESDATSLVLLDELGAGTDPEEGAALARAILEELEARGTLVMATTHLDPLKAFAATHPGAQNASVEFDGDRLTPTFRLLYGRPGRSYALTIGARLGLPDNVIERAHTLRSEQAKSLEGLLESLDAQARESAEGLRTLETERSQAAALLAQAQREVAEAKARAAETIVRAKAEAAALLGKIRQAVAHEWEQLKASERSRRSLEASRKRVATISAGLADLEAPTQQGATPQVGDAVEVSHLGLKGTLVAMGGGTATVQGGGVTLRVPAQALRSASGVGILSRPPSVTVPRGAIPGKSDVPAELHLLGKTREEAQAAVEKYLDHAFLGGLPRVRLVHGKGTGALRKAIHELLAVHPLVENWRPGEPYKGGGGATVVELKVS